MYIHTLISWLLLLLWAKHVCSKAMGPDIIYKVTIMKSCQVKMNLFVSFRMLFSWVLTVSWRGLSATLDKLLLDKVAHLHIGMQDVICKPVLEEFQNYLCVCDISQ